MPATHRGELRPIALTRYYAGIDCDVRRVVAYRALCACGWRSGSMRTMRDARAALREHRAAS